MVHRIAVSAVVAALLVATGITAAQTTLASTTGKAATLNIGNCTTEGQFVSCSVQGDISHPSRISVQVWAVPSQQLTVSWSDLCAQGLTSGDRNGQFNVTAGPHHKVSRSIPLAAGHGGKCTPDALVSMSNSGRLHVYLSGKH